MAITRKDRSCWNELIIRSFKAFGTWPQGTIETNPIEITAQSLQSQTWKLISIEQSICLKNQNLEMLLRNLWPLLPMQVDQMKLQRHPKRRQVRSVPTRFPHLGGSGGWANVLSPYVLYPEKNNVHYFDKETVVSSLCPC